MISTCTRMGMSSTVIVVFRRTPSGLQFARKAPSVVFGVTARTPLHVLWAAVLLFGILLPTPCQGQNYVDVPGKAGNTRVDLPAGLDVANNEAIADWNTSNVKSMRYYMAEQGCQPVLTPGLECATCQVPLPRSATTRIA